MDDKRLTVFDRASSPTRLVGCSTFVDSWRPVCLESGGMPDSASAGLSVLGIARVATPQRKHLQAGSRVARPDTGELKRWRAQQGNAAAHACTRPSLFWFRGRGVPVAVRRGFVAMARHIAQATHLRSMLCVPQFHGRTALLFALSGFGGPGGPSAQKANCSSFLVRNSSCACNL